MKKSLLSVLGLAFALAVSMPILGADNANAATKQAPGAATASTPAPASDGAMTKKHVKMHKKHVKKHKMHAKKHTMAKKAY